jgi:hypothetical protein
MACLADICRYIYNEDHRRPSIKIIALAIAAITTAKRSLLIYFAHNGNGH